MPTGTGRFSRRFLIRAMPIFLHGTARTIRWESDQRHPSATMFSKLSTWVMWKIGGLEGPPIQRPRVSAFSIAQHSARSTWTYEASRSTLCSLLRMPCVRTIARALHGFGDEAATARPSPRDRVGLARVRMLPRRLVALSRRGTGTGASSSPWPRAFPRRLCDRREIG
jgi:hypothetical protein